jgi:glycosyltransferase involved in cell wall biosynthesis
MSCRLIVLTRSNSQSAAPVTVARLLASEMARQGVQTELRHLATCAELMPGELPWRASMLDALMPGDVVHTHGLRPDLVMAIARLRGRLKPGVRWISTVHCDIPKDMGDLVGARLGPWVTRLWLMALHRADRVVFLSEAARNSACLPSDRAKVITNGLSAELPVPAHEPPSALQAWLRQRPNGATVIATFAVPRPLKGIELMLQAVAACADFHFFHAGDGPGLHTLRKMAQSMGIERRCLFLGFVPEAMNLLPYCDVYLNCSSSEGSPLSVLEAMRAGVPVVAPRISPFTEFLDIPPLRLYRPGEVDDLVHSILATKAVQGDASVAVRSIFDQRFTLSQTVKSYLELLAD